MAATGDRAVAGLLSTLAEAADFQAAASALLGQLVEISAAARACMLRLDAGQERLVLVASIGFEPDSSTTSVPIDELSNPLVASTLSLANLRGAASLAGAFAPFDDWIALAMPQPRSANSLGTLPVTRASELLAPMRIEVVERADSRPVAPAGVVLLGGARRDALENASRLLWFASPLVARLASIEQQVQRVRQAAENERPYEALKRLNSDLEERVREATADLAEQNARLHWQSQEVERANKLKSEFLASMSHELRTPINALIGYSALLLDGVLGDVNPKQRDALARGRAAAEHLLALINDILDLAKIEAGKMPLHLEDVSLRDVILEVAQQIEPMVRKKQLELEIDVAAHFPPIHSDRTKIRQVLLNLLSNAVKFTNKGRVSVEVRPATSGVRIDVVDTGIGIRQSDLQAIWEDFRQVDQSRTREFGGTGLGLSITRKLLERLGGSVTVRSVYGEGSRFTVYLPARMPHGNLSEQPTIEAAEAR